MKKIYFKLIVVAVQLAIAFSVVGMSSYAWLVLSSNPTVEGIQIAIGGGNTILVAADLKEVMEDGTIYHYPDRFQDTLNFSRHESYTYLSELGDLSPVSTADGINWFLPAYYDVTDQEVKDGNVLSGQLKPIEKFTLDDTLDHANLDQDDADAVIQGNYVYLDFWVVSPGSDYTLRVSTGEDSGGSFAIGLMQGEEKEDGSGYTLVDKGDNAASSVRVGMLVNPDTVYDNSLWYYQDSAAYSDQYTRLKGTYMEKGGSRIYSSDYRFTIYEPNGEKDGVYNITQPLGLVDGSIQKVDIRDRLTVQKTSKWAMAENEIDTQIEQRFQTAITAYQDQNLTAEELTQNFYQKYLSGQVSPYVDKGEFFKSTSNLYNALSGSGEESFLSQLQGAGATDDVYIVKLEKNVPQRIRMFVWLEGEDIDCVNSINTSSFALKIELAGSNMEE